MTSLLLTRKKLARALRMLYSFLYYEGVVKRTVERTVETRMLGFTLSVPPTVFHPRFYFTSGILGSQILGMSLQGKSVLDAGCGSGILSLAAASAGAFVTAIDINSAAVEATRQNSRRNNLDRRIKVIENDLCGGLPPDVGRFDMIITNPPYYRVDPRSPVERAFRGGASNGFMAKLAEASLNVLAPQGSILTVLSSDVDIPAVLQPFTISNFRETTLSETRRLFELIKVLRLDKVEKFVEAGSYASI